ncbi:MAG: sensor histidine kinase, partial [Sphingomonadales bacterium]|nr:sensor histidine kinase [Sphingomonadales bacterium]
MTRPRLGRRAVLIALWLALVGAAAFGVRALSLAEGLARVEDRGRADLQLAADRLVSALLQFREVAVLAADHPQVVALAAGPLRGRDAD